MFIRVDMVVAKNSIGQEQTLQIPKQILVNMNHVSTVWEDKQHNFTVMEFETGAMIAVNNSLDAVADKIWEVTR